jgi:hypothetical protein
MTRPQQIQISALGNACYITLKVAPGESVRLLIFAAGS